METEMIDDKKLDKLRCLGVSMKLDNCRIIPYRGSDKSRQTFSMLHEVYTQLPELISKIDELKAENERLAQAREKNYLAALDLFEMIRDENPSNCPYAVFGIDRDVIECNDECDDHCWGNVWEIFKKVNEVSLE